MDWERRRARREVGRRDFWPSAPHPPTVVAATARFRKGESNSIHGVLGIIIGPQSDDAVLVKVFSYSHDPVRRTTGQKLAGRHGRPGCLTRGTGVRPWSIRHAGVVPTLDGGEL